MNTPTPMNPAPPPSSMFQGASPKLTFLFGLIAGVALTAIVGLAIILPRAYGPTKSKATATTTTDTNTTAPAQTYNDVKPVSSSDYMRGDKNAKLTLIEYSDLECPYCKSFHPTMQQILADYKGQVNWVFRDFPLSFHANAEKEAEASLCIGKLGGNDKYWSFIDKIYERTTSNGTGFALTALGPLAKEVGVNQDKFQSCLDSGEMAQTVKDESADGTTGGVQGTPTTLIVDQNGKTINGIPGAYPVDQAKSIIDAVLAKQ